MLRRHLLVALPAAVMARTAAARPARKASGGLTFAGKPRLSGLEPYANQFVPGLKVVSTTGAKGTRILSLVADKARLYPADLTLGLNIAAAPGFRQGLAFWRYAPWKSWTKPMAMTRWGGAESDDVQCAYWCYEDGTYGAALPLGGNGFRSTLGAGNGSNPGLRTVCRALASARIRGPLPQVAIGFGRDLHALMTDLFDDAMTALGTPQNLRRHKRIPEALTWLGWNTWNASNLGRDLSADWTLAQVEKIRKAGAPIGTVVLDDGHFQARDGQLQSQAPSPVRFPGGFKPVVDALLKDHGLKHVGLWHAFDAYWNGIDPDSELGRRYAGRMFSWTQKPSPTDTSDKRVTYSFLKPEPALLDAYFDAYYARLKADGFTLIKVDNQLVAERMAANNYPVWDLATALHGAINRGAGKYFDNAIINCMDMTNDAFLNFGATPVARSVEDYFPYKPDETYNLQEGNAAAHVLQAMYNALYFGQMVFPDFDMFESTNPNARLHAAVRAANCAPIYVTDKAGDHDVALLKAMVDAEGRTLRADTPLTPVADCLFQIQAPRLFKASSRTGEGALLLLMNLADAERVEGEWRLSDITGLPPGPCAVWSAAMPAPRRLDADTTQAASLPRFGVETVCVAPIIHGVAVFGIADKLNPLAGISVAARDAGAIELAVRDQGSLMLYAESTVRAVTLDGRSCAFTQSGVHVAVTCVSPGRCHVRFA